MRIGELAARSGLSSAAIRFYERRGILPGPGRRENGYREYGPADLDRAATFRSFRDLGLDPVDAGRLADQCATGHCDLTYAQLGPLVAAQRQEIATRLADLHDLDARLAAIQTNLDTTGQSDPLNPTERTEDLMLDRCCDGGCCGGGCC